jgi:DNA-binding CsgD family transcriptional regulator
MQAREVTLTTKQSQTLELLALGNTSKHIAQQCHISPQAVDRRIEGLLRRSGCKNRRELVRWHQQRWSLTPAEETNLGVDMKFPASSNSEQFISSADKNDGWPTPLSDLAATEEELIPEARPNGRRARTRIEWLGFEVTWLQLILVLILVREAYEVFH